ncbi:hypothetical protein Tco_0533981 [Tanacetum coccineum]
MLWDKYENKWEVDGDFTDVVLEDYGKKHAMHRRFRKDIVDICHLARGKRGSEKYDKEKGNLDESLNKEKEQMIMLKGIFVDDKGKGKLDEEEVYNKEKEQMIMKKNDIGKGKLDEEEVYNKVKEQQ